VFVDFPYQREAFPLFFEDMFTVYTLQVDFEKNTMIVQMNNQTRSEDEWESYVKKTIYKLQSQGIYVPYENCNVLATVSRMAGI